MTVAVALFLSACGGKKPEPTPSPAPEAAPPSTTLKALVPAPQLRGVLLEGARVLVIDSRPPAAYSVGHVIGSRSIPLEELDPEQRAGLNASAAREHIADTLAAAGLQPDLDVVIVESGMPDGFARAAHACFVLSLAGCERCRILEGGLPSWQAAGGNGEIALPAPLPKAARLQFQERSDAAVDLAAVRRAVVEPRPLLVDVRNPPTGGAIPGAVRVPITWSIGPDGRVDRKKLDGIISTTTIYSEPSVVVFGSTATDGAAGWFLLARVMGRSAQLFPGGIEEWSRHAELPLLASNRTP